VAKVGLLRFARNDGPEFSSRRWIFQSGPEEPALAGVSKDEARI
jgi:hypothetical protein